MGTGKTFTSLEWSKHFPERECFIFVPKILQSQWEDVSSKWGGGRSFHIQTHDQLFQGLHKTLNLNEKLVIVDEAQLLCEWAHTNPAKPLFTKMWECHRLLLLTGTPFMRSRSDIAILCNLAAREYVMPSNQKDFILKYAQDKSALERTTSTLKQFVVIAAIPIISLLQQGISFAYQPKWKYETVEDAVESVEKNKVYLALVTLLVSLSMLAGFVNVKKSDIFDFGRLNMEKVAQDLAQYCSFYSYDRSDSNYPRFQEEKVEHYYSNYQAEVLVKLAQQTRVEDAIARQLLDDPDFSPTAKEVLTESTGAIIEYGRNIGNLMPQSLAYTYTIHLRTGEVQPKSLAVSDFSTIKKFEYLLKRISQAPSQQKMLIFSNFRNCGCIQLSAFLTLHGVPHYYYNASLTEAARAEIIKDYNRRDRASERCVMIIDSDSIEGLDLVGVEEIHVMEPLIYYSRYLQLMYRGIRSGSHSHLPENRRWVRIFNHVCIVTHCADLNSNARECLVNAWDLVAKNLPHYQRSYHEWQSTMKSHLLWVLNKTPDITMHEFHSPDLVVMSKHAVTQLDYEALTKSLQIDRPVPATCKYRRKSSRSGRKSSRSGRTSRYSRSKTSGVIRP